jgi:hypothetical protein
MIGISSRLAQAALYNPKVFPTEIIDTPVSKQQVLGKYNLNCCVNGFSWVFFPAEWEKIFFSQLRSY